MISTTNPLQTHLTLHWLYGMTFRKHLRMGGSLREPIMWLEDWKFQSHLCNLWGAERGSRWNSVTTGWWFNQSCNVMKRLWKPKRTGLRVRPGWWNHNASRWHCAGASNSKGTKTPAFRSLPWLFLLLADVLYPLYILRQTSNLLNKQGSGILWAHLTNYSILWRGLEGRVWDFLSVS